MSGLGVDRPRSFPFVAVALRMRQPFETAGMTPQSKCKRYCMRCVWQMTQGNNISCVWEAGRPSCTRCQRIRHECIYVEVQFENLVEDMEAARLRHEVQPHRENLRVEWVEAAKALRDAQQFAISRNRKRLRNAASGSAPDASAAISTPGAYSATAPADVNGRLDALSGEVQNLARVVSAFGDRVSALITLLVGGFSLIIAFTNILLDSCRRCARYGSFRRCAGCGPAGRRPFWRRWRCCRWGWWRRWRWR